MPNKNGIRDEGETSAIEADSDGDLMIDGDGIDNLTEHASALKLDDPDSDADGVIDGQEPDWNQDTDGDGFINALDPDSDADGLKDGQEVFDFFTGSLLPDTDGDGLSDGNEVLVYHSSPLQTLTAME